ncbi:MAG: outer membrane beta-barrel protein [Pirellulales bacterium]|nr:outer membrane beta-barrel protein [Pirellulales bacterium]
MRQFLRASLLALACLGVSQMVGADEPATPMLRPTVTPVLVPIDHAEPDPPTTVRLLTGEPSDEPRVGQSQLRLIEKESKKQADSKTPVNDTPPEGPWCFAEDDPAHGETEPGQPSREKVRVEPIAASGIVEVVPSEPNAPRPAVGRPGRPYDIQWILAILEDKEDTPVELAQASPAVPRVLPSPRAALSSDSTHDDLLDLVRPAPVREEPRETPRRPTPRIPRSHIDPIPEEPYYPSAPEQRRPSPPPKPAEEYFEGLVPESGEPCHLRNTRCGSGYGAVCVPLKPGPRRLLEPACLTCRDITFGGWVDQGVSAVANNPTDRYNGPVTFNDRCGEYQLNQLNFFVERQVCTDGCGWDFGGRIDFLFGTDARFAQADDGLESDWKQRERFYQAALPQFYLDVGFNDWTVRLGHFYKIMGYEQVAAPDNFFYSHSYAFQYGEPKTETGMLASRKLGGGLSLSGGFSRGSDQFDDTDGRNQLGFIGGIDWASPDGRRSVQFALSSGEQGPGNSTMIYSLVGQLQVTDRLSWVLEHNFGQSTGGNRQGVRVAEWYGLSQYVVYQLTETWDVGARIEWFCDVDGTVVHGLGQGNLATGPYIGSFYDLSLGLNWKPGPNLVFRPEVRWDWFHGDSVGGNRPYDAGHCDQQFLYGFDLIVKF